MSPPFPSSSSLLMHPSDPISGKKEEAERERVCVFIVPERGGLGMGVVVAVGRVAHLTDWP